MIKIVKQLIRVSSTRVDSYIYTRMKREKKKKKKKKARECLGSVKDREMKNERRKKHATRQGHHGIEVSSICKCKNEKEHDNIRIF